MVSRACTSPLPPSWGPEAGTDATTVAFDDARASEARLHALMPTVAVVAAEPTLRESLSASIQSGGRAVGGEELVPVATVVVTDAGAGAKGAVAGLRTRARSDAALIVVLAGSAPATEVDAAYEAGALLCLRAPVDEHQLMATIDSAIDLHTAKVQADDLKRQLDVQAHLASLGRVTAGFTHEVSNPLAVFSLNLQNIRDSVAFTSPAEEVRLALDDMGFALDRLQGVLATARALAQEGPTCHIEDVDLALLVSDVRRLSAGELEGVEVQELIDEPIVARADPRLLHLIVLNLVTNAAHAVRQLPAPRIRLHVYGSNDIAILSVRDNGPGILPEILDRIFEPFFTTRRGQGGTGLGLALCREYATRMKARVSLWTAPGRGACFRVHMPRQIEARSGLMRRAEARER